MEKEHHLTKAKRLREEALAKESVVGSVDSVAPDVAPTPVAKVVSKWYHIFDKRANLIGYSPVEVEAPAGGFIKAL